LQYATQLPGVDQLHGAIDPERELLPAKPRPAHWPRKLKFELEQRPSDQLASKLQLHANADTEQKGKLQHESHLQAQHIQQLGP